MTKILKAIGDYGFTLEKYEIDNENYYLCINEQSHKSFVLDVNWKNGKSLNGFNKYNELGITKDIAIIYFLEVNNNIDDIIHIFENFLENNDFLLIYDQNEEFEFFMKDLWNLLIQLESNVN